MRAVVEISPSSSFAFATPLERVDAMTAFAGRLMGLSHALHIGGQAREVDYRFGWPRPPRLERRWFAAISDVSADALQWRTRTLTEALEGIGLRCGAASIVDDLAPQHARVQSDAVLDADGYWCCTLVLRRWPREVASGWLGHALAADIPVDVALHLQPQDPQRIARFLKKQQQMLTEHDAGHQLGREDAERVRMKLIARTDRPVNVAVVFTVRAAERAVLRERVNLLTYELGLTLSDARVATFEQDRGLHATLPSGRCDLLGAWHTLDCTSVASTWPFQPATVNHNNGAPLGTTHGMLVKLDPFDPALESFGGVVLAKVGAGKSYLLKLLARRLEGVEVLIVEQRSPAEYAGIPGAQTFNLAAVAPGERAAQLRDFVSQLWETAKSEPRPRLLILDELWSLLRDPGLAGLVEEIARIGRHHWLSLWIATQQVEEMLASEQGLAVLNNAAIRIYLKQTGPDGELLARKLNLSQSARQFLRGAARGQALLDVAGMLIPVDIQADPREHQELTTDPRERYGIARLGALSGSGNGHAADAVGPARAMVVAGRDAAGAAGLDARQ